MICCLGQTLESGLYENCQLQINLSSTCWVNLISYKILNSCHSNSWNSYFAVTDMLKKKKKKNVTMVCDKVYIMYSFQKYNNFNGSRSISFHNLFITLSCPLPFDCCVLSVDVLLIWLYFLCNYGNSGCWFPQVLTLWPL